MSQSIRRRGAVARRVSAWVAITLGLVGIACAASAQVSESMAAIPTRPGVEQRVLLLSPPQPRAAVILFPGGHGGLQISSDGAFRWGAGNFLVRTRHLFAEKGLLVLVVDAPSDRQRPPFLSGQRQRPEHVEDIAATIAWARRQARVPVWLVGTSRGTQSAAWVATQLAGESGPDGLVLTSTIVVDDDGRPVPAMPLDRLRIPVLIVHHEQDGCRLCPFREVPPLLAKLANAPRKELVPVSGGDSRGDPCEARAYHGFNGLDDQVVKTIADWILAP